MLTRLTRQEVFSLFILLLPLFFPVAGFSQTTTGTILGTVTDAAADGRGAAYEAWAVEARHAPD
ncbi:MAG TPA: hypothetical protein VMM84_01605 [Pyrinomonadaceae bacterium]|nr:hypothetical protein [Pyrinomonadaceae bacterium]